jgi:hypothetical protein
MARHYVEVTTVYQIDAPTDTEVIPLISEDNELFFTTGAGLPNVKVIREDFSVLDIDVDEEEE